MMSCPLFTSDPSPTTTISVLPGSKILNELGWTPQGVGNALKEGIPCGCCAVWSGIGPISNCFVGFFSTSLDEFFAVGGAQVSVVVGCVTGVAKQVAISVDMGIKPRS